MIGWAGKTFDKPLFQTRSTALHKAAKKGFADIARLLVEKGADVNISDVSHLCMWQDAREEYKG